MEAIMKVYAISNGFLLETVTGKVTTTYVKDAVGIAEEIIAQQARVKLDVPRQHEMFTDVDLGTKPKT